jgi:hypothetical protein
VKGGSSILARWPGKFVAKNLMAANTAETDARLATPGRRS